MECRRFCNRANQQMSARVAHSDAIGVVGVKADAEPTVRFLQCPRTDVSRCRLAVMAAYALLLVTIEQSTVTLSVSALVALVQNYCGMCVAPDPQVAMRQLRSSPAVLINVTSSELCSSLPQNRSRIVLTAVQQPS